MRYALLFCLAAAAHAQPDSVPADLLYAFAQVSDSDRVAVGEAPARLAAVLPEDSEVVGTLYSRRAGDGDGSGVVVARVPQGPEAASLAFEASLPAGWSRLEDPGGEAEGGFTSSGFSDGAFYLCSDDPQARQVSVAFTQRPGGGSLLLVGDNGWTRRGCDGEIRDGFSSSSRPDFRVTLSDLPALGPPPGGRQTSHGGGGSTDTQGQEATLTWDGTAGDALGHYAGSLAQAGWTPVSMGSTAGAAAGTWARSDGDEPRTVTLSVLQTKPEQFELRLQLIAYPVRD